MIRYKNIARFMRENHISTYDILKNRLIPQSVMTRLRTNGAVSTKTIDHLCQMFHCQPGDILEYVEENKPEE